ncbi:protein maelstrom 1-like [Teleopsis dalmanni]|uniref:protein maelstrom 1-like n=1 Tax=Teleopsis dalmanni TaxID=139649 RepID=UPI0018CF0B27|nr:protein maelstrom 1-like [Teleopsis dalmanni]
MPKPNGFMVFTMEWKQRHGHGMSIAEATAMCGKKWEDMDEEARKPYQTKAKKQRETSKAKPKQEPCCNTGDPLSVLLKEKEERENYVQQTKRNIESIVKKSQRSDRFTTDCYVVIAVNYFSKSLNGNIYVPAEISLAEFSLKRGIIKTYHTHVNPGVSMYGHQYDAQLHADETHKLPLPPDAIGERNLANIYNEILKFAEDKENGGYRPLYVRQEHIPIAKSVVEFLQIDSDVNEIKFKIYPVQYLFYLMKETACKIGELSPPSIIESNAFFERDYFEYHTGISCEYHENIDRSIHCTQSVVVRSCYMFCDYMCEDVAVDIIPGRHIPIKQKIDMKIIEPKVDNKEKSYQKLFNNESVKKEYSSSYGRNFKNEEFPSLSMPMKKKKNFQPKPRDPENSDSEFETKPVMNPFGRQNNYRYDNLPPKPTLQDFDVTFSDAESISTVNSFNRKPWREIAQEDGRSESEFSTTSNRSFYESRTRGRGRGGGRSFMSYDSDFPSLN